MSKDSLHACTFTFTYTTLHVIPGWFTVYCFYWWGIYKIIHLYSTIVCILACNKGLHTIRFLLNSSSGNGWRQCNDQKAFCWQDYRAQQTGKECPSANSPRAAQWGPDSPYHCLCWCPRTLYMYMCYDIVGTRIRWQIFPLLCRGMV